MSPDSRVRWLAGLAAAGLLPPFAAHPAVPAAANSAAAALACAPVDAFGHWLVSAADAGGTNDAGDDYGAAVASGDFDGDGFADVAVGAPDDAVGGVRAGAVFIFRGSAAGIGTGIRLTQSNAGAANEAGDRFGAVLAAGDFNGDGFADLVVGAPDEAIGSATGSGAIMVFPGSAAGLGSGYVRDQSHAGGSNEAGDQLGAAVGTGDVTGDGIADLVVGTPSEAPGADPAGGVVFVFRGSASGLVGNGYRTQEDAGGNTEAGDQFGAAVAAGDVTGDGIADLVVGAPTEAPNTSPAGGAIYVLPGPGLTAGSTAPRRTPAAAPRPVTGSVPRSPSATSTATPWRTSWSARPARHPAATRPAAPSSSSGAPPARRPPATS